MALPHPTTSKPTPTQPRIIIHGGAGNITRARLPPSSYASYRASLLSILSSTSSRLAAGASALDAATHAVVQLENDPLFNCGRGAVFTRAGTIELEASVMVSRGYAKRGVGVSLLKRVRHPILLAREMLVRGERDLRGSEADDGGDGGDGGDDGDVGAQGHCQLSGEVAEGLARKWGLEMCREKDHWTRRRWEEHRRGLKGEKRGGLSVDSWEDMFQGDEERCAEPGWDGYEYLPQGTVGCVVLDKYGVLCTATSTGGLTNKLPGRIGDTPTLGAGFWAEEWSAPPSSPNFGRMPFGNGYSTLSWLIPDFLKANLKACLPQFAGYEGIQDELGSYDDSMYETRGRRQVTRAAAVSGTGNGDSFLRTAAARTTLASCRYIPSLSLTAAVTGIAGPNGELQRSAEDRWGKTGEGEGGIIGIESVHGRGIVVADFNCGGMFRAWIDNHGRHRMMVFREEYQVN